MKRILVTALLGGALLITAPTAAQADKDSKHDRTEARRESHEGRHEARERHDSESRHEARERHDSDSRHEAREHRDGDHDRRHYRHHDGRYDDYYRYYGWDDGYYNYYGYRCNGYRGGYYYDRSGRPIYGRDGRPYYRRNGDCDTYYNRYHRWYGEPYCSRYDYETGYCD
jgi:Ni/Co efflux regulator RcnB